MPSLIGIARDAAPCLLRDQAPVRDTNPSPLSASPTCALSAALSDAPDIVCLVPDNLPLETLDPHARLLARGTPNATTPLADGCIGTTLALDGNGFVTIVLAPGDPGSMTWAGFRRPGESAAPGLSQSALWELRAHNLGEPLPTSRRFVASENPDALIEEFRRVFVETINPALPDPFFLPGDSARLEMAARDRSGRAETRMAQAACAIAGGMIAGAIGIAPAHEPGRLPVVDVFLDKGRCDPNLDDDAVARLRSEIALAVEYLLIGWVPEGAPLLADGTRRAALTRSEVERVLYVEIPIEVESAHQLIEDTIATRALVAEIESAKPWLSDICFGRRTDIPRHDAPDILERLKRRLA